MSVASPASDAVMAADHPSPSAGGPCATCAFRPGTEANCTDHTVQLARACVEGIVPFYCHEQLGLCPGFVAAVNLRGAPTTEADRRWQEISHAVAELISDLIAHARQQEVS